MYKVSFNNRKFIVNAKDEYDAVQKIYENIYDGVSPMTYKKLRERGYNEKDWENWDDETKVKKSQEDETKVEVYVLTGDNKIKALAELAGGEINEQSIEFAKSLLA